MPTKLVRLSVSDQTFLKELSRERGESMQEILHRAIEGYRRELLLTEANAAYAKLKENDSLRKERSEWDATASDGLEVNE